MFLYLEVFWSILLFACFCSKYTYTCYDTEATYVVNAFLVFFYRISQLISILLCACVLKLKLPHLALQVFDGLSCGLVF